MIKKINEVHSYFIFSGITIGLGCLIFYGSTISNDSKVNYYIWGSLLCILGVALCIAGFYTKQEYDKILKFGTILDAIVISKIESPETSQINLIVTYMLDEKETTNMLLDSFNTDCSLDVGDIIKICVYNGKAILVEEN